MGGGGSKWRKVAVGPPLPAEEKKTGSAEEGAAGGGQKRRGQHRSVTCRRRADGSQSTDAGNVERELDRAATKWGLSPRLRAEGGSSQRSSLSTWRLPKAPWGDCTPSIQCLTRHHGTSGSPKNPRPTEAEGEQGLPAGSRPSAQTTYRLSTSPRRLPTPAHDILLIKTRDVENNGFQISGKSTSPNLTPILYDFSEEELMASIEKDYS
ncbi:uncharacterized protein [Narcine bancroftii]|uniref:uncharacterized protein n=1 Tax=Narcine bancroftii TaxID=1343680 RepID=UPI003831F1DF